MSDGVMRTRGSDPVPRYDLYGGVVLAVLAAVLFAASYWEYLVRMPSAVTFLGEWPFIQLDNLMLLTVRASIVVFGAVGIGISVGVLRVSNQQDFYGGMSLVLLALTAFVLSNNLPGMRGFAFGPGTAPRLFALALAILSLGVAVGGVMTRGPKVGAYRLRGVIFIIGSILAFALAIRPAGLVFASFCTMVLCAAATEDIKWLETLIIAALVTAFCAVLFPYFLNLPFQLWPRF